MIVEPHAEHLVWLDGAFIPWREASMHVSDNHYGVAVFEGVRAYSGQGGITSVFRLQDHTARLFRSARMLNIDIPAPYDCEHLNHVQLELLRKTSSKDAYLRPFVFYRGAFGLSPRGRNLSVHVAVMSLHWEDGDAYHGTGVKARGLRLRTATFTRHANSTVWKAKANANYLPAILALKEAQAAGADDVLLLDQNGLATETSGANLFIVRDGTICTPPLASVLEGVTRDTIMTLAAEIGRVVVERPLTREDVYTADEAFLTGTATEVVPVCELDGRRVGTGGSGPITSRLQAMYTAHVRGRGEHHRDWLTAV